MKSREKNKGNNKGSVLIASIGILAVLSAMALAFALMMKTEMLITGNYIDQVRAEFAVKTGLAQAIRRIKEGYTADKYFWTNITETSGANELDDVFLTDFIMIDGRNYSFYPWGESGNAWRYPEVIGEAGDNTYTDGTLTTEIGTGRREHPHVRYSYRVCSEQAKIAMCDAGLMVTHGTTDLMDYTPWGNYYDAMCYNMDRNI